MLVFPYNIWTYLTSLQQSDAKEPRPKKVQDPEKAAKVKGRFFQSAHTHSLCRQERERLEKKAVRAEREQKEKDAHNKSQSIMAKFFSKPPKTRATLVKAQESAIAGPSRIKSDFEKTFKPFVLQKDKTLAPTNWFLAEKKRKRTSTKQPNNTEVIILDEEIDVEMQDPQPSEQELAAMSSQGNFYGF